MRMVEGWTLQGLVWVVLFRLRAGVFVGARGRDQRHSWAPRQEVSMGLRGVGFRYKGDEACVQMRLGLGWCGEWVVWNWIDMSEGAATLNHAAVPCCSRLVVERGETWLVVVINKYFSSGRFSFTDQSTPL